VIIDCGEAGVVIIEVKYHSGNDLRDDGHWDRYLPGPGAFDDPAKAKASQLYELVRNWRIAHDLAAGRPFTLVNLATATKLKTTKGIDDFNDSLRKSPEHSFLPLRWDLFLAALEKECMGLPPWLDGYLRERKLLKTTGR
jgi:hypothetical protein